MLSHQHAVTSKILNYGMTLLYLYFPLSDSIPLQTHTLVILAPLLSRWGQGHSLW